MAKKRNAADVLVAGPADEIFRRITAWHQADNPSPDDLLKWLRAVTELVSMQHDAIVKSSPELRELPEVKRLEYASMMQNCEQFWERAKVAAQILSGMVPTTTADAFVEGLRIGLIHEHMMSILDGRYPDKWERHDNRQRGAFARNKEFVEMHATYQREVDELRHGDDDPGCHEACRIVADRYIVDFETVRKNTTNPLPNKRVRRKKS